MRKLRGGKAEDLASAFLLKNGYKIVERNFRNKLGEIDIIAKEQKIVVFIEVRSMSAALLSTAAESITSKKIKKIIRVAESYINYKKLEGNEFRFDVVIIDNGKIELIKNAFTV